MICGPGRERRRGRHRRGPGRHLQDGEPQPPELHRALSGRGDRRGRHPARRLHHGRAAGRQPERAALRRARAPQDPHLLAGVVAGIGGYGNCVGVPTVGGEVNFDPAYNGNILVNAMTVGLAPADRIFYSAAAGAGQPGGLCRLQDRTRRHPRRHHGLGRVRRRQRGKAPHGPGRRPLHRKAADRGLPRTDGHRRHRRHPGHGRRRPDLLFLRDGLQGRRRRRTGSRPGALPRRRHDALRDDALRKPGAHADGAEAGQGGSGPPDLREMGPGLRRHRPTDRDRPHGLAITTATVVGDMPVDPLAEASPEYDRPWTLADAGTSEIAATRSLPCPEDSMRRTRCNGPDGIARTWLQALGLGAVRPHGHGRHRRAPRRRRRGRAGARHPPGAGHDHRLHAALLSGDPGPGGRPRRSPRPGATSPQLRRPTRSPSPTT